jgi:hypothetical protein
MTNSQLIDQHRYAVGNLTKVSQSLRNKTFDAVGEGSHESSLVDNLHARKVNKPRQRFRPMADNPVLDAMLQQQETLRV